MDVRQYCQRQLKPEAAFSASASRSATTMCSACGMRARRTGLPLPEATGGGSSRAGAGGWLCCSSLASALLSFRRSVGMAYWVRGEASAAITALRGRVRRDPFLCTGAVPRTLALRQPIRLNMLPGDLPDGIWERFAQRKRICSERCAFSVSRGRALPFIWAIAFAPLLLFGQAASAIRLSVRQQPAACERSCPILLKTGRDDVHAAHEVLNT